MKYYIIEYINDRNAWEWREVIKTEKTITEAFKLWLDNEEVTYDGIDLDGMYAYLINPTEEHRIYQIEPLTI